MQSVIATPIFEADAKAAGLTDDEVAEMVTWLSENPQGGVIMQGAGGARKVRFAGKGRGKSGGYRTIHYFAGDDVPIFLLALINKGERDNITKAEKNVLSEELAHLVDDYRKGVARLAELKRKR